MSTTIKDRIDTVTIPGVLNSLGRLGPRISRLYTSGRHLDLVSSVINPSGYDDWREFYVDYQALNLVKKYPRLRTGLNLKDIAVEKFVKSEDVCTIVNQRFGALTLQLTDGCIEALNRARSIISRTLGDFSWDDALKYCDFGPGANVGVPRKHGHQCEKIGNLNPTVTGCCKPLLDSYVRFDPHLSDVIGPIRVVEGSKSVTVPKDARSDRFIAIEPLWNMFFQKGIGGLIRSRLRSVGFDLDNGWVRNQQLALLGSTDGSLATIDLSSASDTISIGLIEYLLPEAWLLAMKTVRSPFCELPDGRVLLLRKFSSMGNGFTFELETLVFWAIAKAVTGWKDGCRVAVFGDDIVLPTQYADRLIGVLREVGFKTNLEKTFVSGPFRESCGKHYFSGRDVTPIFIKKEVADYHGLFVLINSIRRLAYRLLGTGYGCDNRLEKDWLLLIGALPGRFQCLSCPDGFGDNAIVRDFDEVSPRPRTSHSLWEGWESRSLVRSSRTCHYDGPQALVAKLWNTRRERSLDEATQYELYRPEPRFQLRVRKSLYPRWTTLGPWVNGL